MKLLHHKIVLFLSFERLSILFSIVAAPIYIPASVWIFLFPLIFSNIYRFFFLILAILTDVKWYRFVLLVYIFPDE